QMRGFQHVVVAPDCDGLGVREGLLETGGQFVRAHGGEPLLANPKRKRCGRNTALQAPRPSPALTLTPGPGPIWRVASRHYHARGIYRVTVVNVIRFEPRASAIGRAAWSAWNTLQLIYTIAWTAGCITLALLVLLLRGGNRHIPLRMASRLWAPGLLFGAGAKLRIEGLERVDFSKPHVFVANHQSIIDICALFRALPVPIRFVIKQEIAKVPFIGWYARAMGMVFIERGHAREATERLHGVVSLIRAGESLCAFPEGTRSRNGSVGP